MATYRPNQRDNRNRPPKVRRRQTTDFSINLSGKHVFGAYFNMARSNFNKTIWHILPQVGIKGQYKEGKVAKMLQALYLLHSGQGDLLTQEQRTWKNNLLLKNPEQKTKLQSLLIKHFPVLVPLMADVAEMRARNNKKKSTVRTEDETVSQMKGVELTDYLQTLALIALTLTECRNFYTHSAPYNTSEELSEQYKHQEQVAEMLDKVITASRRVLKEREGLMVRELEFLTGIDRLEQVDLKDRNNKVIIKNNKKLKTFKEYDDFYFSVRGERDGHKALSDFGLLYFCVLFLTKPYAKLLIDECRLFEFSPFKDDENVIMQEMMSIYRIHVPLLHRINSRDDKAALAMDMLAEMRRCPRELYDLLSPEDQHFFHDEITDEEGQGGEVVKRLRYTDRFPQLALRYIDETEMFKRIRFQLNLGTFRYRFYDKICIDGRQRVRRIQKRINGYGRLQEVAEKRLEKWGDMLQKKEEQTVILEDNETSINLDCFVQDTADTLPYITDKQPSYNISENRIGLFWESSKNKKEYDFFDADDMYLPELRINDDGKTEVPMPTPRCFLSIHDLNALVFYEYLRNHYPGEQPSAEQIIMDYEAEYRRFFDDMASGRLRPAAKTKDFRNYLAQNYPLLSIAGIPEKLKLFLSGKSRTHEGQPETERQRLIRLTVDALNRREEITERRLTHYLEAQKKIGDKTNKLGKKSFASIRHGELAEYLGMSLMEWQPSKDGAGQDKLTGLNYKVLVDFLSTYGSQTADSDTLTLEQVLQNAHLLGGANPHPFIGKVLSKGNRNIEELYQHYLETELQHIRSRRQALQDNPSDKSLAALPFVHFERERYAEHTEEQMRTLAGRYESIQLPDGLFTPYILQLLRQCDSGNAGLQAALNDETEAKRNPLNNASYLINLYFKHIMHDEAQPYYFFKRAYELFPTLSKHKAKTFPFELLPIYMTPDEIQKRLSDKILDDDGNPIPQEGEKGRIKRDEQNNIIWQRQITNEIDKYVDGLSDKELKISFNQSWQQKQKERSEKREMLRAKLVKETKRIKDNERAIRRYKNQDMTLFLAAKGMLMQILSVDEQSAEQSGMRMENVCADTFLRQAATLRIPIKVGDKLIYVEQEKMSIKNYGVFYRCLSDERLPSLMDNIAENIKANENGEYVIRFGDLMGELASYDRKRLEIFRLMQLLEAMIIRSDVDLQDRTKDGFWLREGMPKRNNFNALVSLLDQLNGLPLTSEQRTLIIAIRNAFSHNTYNIDLSSIKEVKHLPEVASGILKHLQQMIEKK